MIQNNNSDWNYYCFKDIVKAYTPQKTKEISKEEEDKLLDVNNWSYNKKISKPTESNETKIEDATLDITDVALVVGAVGAVIWLLSL